MATHTPEQDKHRPEAPDCGCQDCCIDRLVQSAPVPTPEQAARLARLLRIGGA